MAAFKLTITDNETGAVVQSAEIDSLIGGASNGDTEQTVVFVISKSNKIVLANAIQGTIRAIVEVRRIDQKLVDLVIGDFTDKEVNP